MAKIKYSALVSDMRNKLNGSVMSKNRYGSYVRNKVTPVNPQSSFQQNARQILGNLSSSFRELTASQIAAWNAKSKDFPFTDIFGDIRHLTGQTLFVKLNANLEKLALPRVSDAPDPVGFPQYDILSGTAKLNQNGSIAEVNFETGIEDLDNLPGYTTVVYATRPMSKSISFVKNEFRFVGIGEPDLLGSVSITTAWTNRFGTAKEDEVIHIKFALVSNATGQQGVPVSIALPVEASA